MYSTQITISSVLLSIVILLAGNCLVTLRVAEKTAFVPISCNTHVAMDSFATDRL